MTREEARAIYRAGEETVVRVLVEMDARLHDAAGAIHALERQVPDLTIRLEASERRVRQLEEQVAKDSHNSSKPPSSDGLSTPKPKSLRPPSERPTGGQPGHPGRTLRMVAKPDRTVRHPVERCVGCGRSLTQQAPDRVERRQVFDLPEPKLEVTEHQAEVKTCTCGCVNRAAFPPEAAAPVQYGLRVKSVAVYLKEYQLLPFDRLTEIMRDLFACATFSEGTLANLSAACSRRLQPVDELIRAQAATADVAGFDETGVRATGSLHWLHTVSTHWLTWYFAHTRRGCEAMNAAGILPYFRGRAVHDFWDSYLKYDCDHAFCNAHLLRELIFLWEEQGQAWAKTMIDHLLAIKTAADTARDAGLAALPVEDLDWFLKRYQQIVEAGYAQNPLMEPSAGPTRRGRRKQSKARNLLDRFRNHPDGILAFMRDFSVPFDNNLSERDLRMMKLRQKISGTFRSFDALVDFCRIRGYVSTARKNGLNALEALCRVFLGNPFVPAVNTT
ncbi:IS66 family transposase [Candidatus Fermentibacteria bacterium]|nr:IS66 family transposase [Candidatus Fermentibacteria bacterium]